MFGRWCGNMARECAAHARGWRRILQNTRDTRSFFLSSVAAENEIFIPIFIGVLCERMNLAETLRNITNVTFPLGVSGFTFGLLSVPLFDKLSRSARSPQLARVATRLTRAGGTVMCGSIVVCTASAGGLALLIALRNLS